MSLETSSLTEVFDKAAFNLDNKEGYRKEAIDNIGKIFAFNLTGAGQGQWYVDARDSGTVGTGLAPKGKTADVTFELDTLLFQGLQAVNEETMRVFREKGMIKISGNGRVPEEQLLKIACVCNSKLWQMGPADPLWFTNTRE